MRQASKSSLQYLLRQLYLAKTAAGQSSTSAASSSSSAITESTSNGIRNGIHAFSTTSSSRTTYPHQSTYVDGLSSSSSSSSSSPTPAPFVIVNAGNENGLISTTTSSHHSTNEGQTQQQVYSYSTSTTESGGQRQQSHHPRATSASARSAHRHSNYNKRSHHVHQHQHHYHRTPHHNGQQQQQQQSVGATSNFLPPSFWISPGAVGSGSGAGSGLPPPPPLPSSFSSPNGSPSSSGSSSPVPFASTSSSSSAPSTSAASTAGTNPAAVTLSSNQDQISDSTSSLPSHLGNDVDDSASKNQISHSALTLYPGAYGIPKRPSGSAPSKSKGKEKELLDPSDPIQAQIKQMQQSLLSVQVGEDAYFVRHDSLGVADGVGGWSGRKGADPGLFAARLMHHCSAELDYAEHLASQQNASSSASSSSSTGLKRSNTKLSFVSTASANANQVSTTSSSSSSSSPPSNNVKSGNKDKAGAAEKGGSETNNSKNRKEAVAENGDPNDGGDQQTTEYQPTGGDPIEVLHQAWDLTLGEFFDFELIGSSTALIALLKEDELRLANIGDCCCSIIRGKEYIFRLQEQQHSFNYPFQMGTNSQDTPRKDGQRFNIKIQKDDIIILSSDGLVDNLFDEDILEEVLKYDDLKLGEANQAERISKALCSRAKAVSEDQRAVTSPFQQRANEEGIHFVGGKHDDISVLVAIIGDKEDAGASGGNSS